MLEYLRLVNFQIWKDITFTYVPGINVHVGESDKGKSSILRALFWWALNKPSGDEFIRDGADFCLVEGGLSGNNIIQRYRSKKENKYVVNGEVFSTVRTGVPKEVQNILHLSETNFQMQDDPFFLIGLSSPGDVAKKLNSVVGLDKIDTSISYPDKIVRRMNSKARLLKEALSEKKKKLNRYKCLDKTAPLIKRLEKVEKKVDKVGQDIVALNKHIKVIMIAKTAIKREAEIREIERKLSTLSSLKKKYEIDTLKLVKLRENINSIMQNQRIIKQYRKSYGKIKKSVEELESLIFNWSKDIENITKLRHSIENITTAQEVVKVAKEKKEVLSRKYETLEKDLRVCPLCGAAFGRKSK